MQGVLATTRFVKYALFVSRVTSGEKVSVYYEFQDRDPEWQMFA